MTGQLEAASNGNWKTTKKTPAGGGQGGNGGSNSYVTVKGYEKSHVVSALQKCIRRGDEEEALFWASELLSSEMQYDFWRRIAAITAEDIGLADPMMPAKIAGLNDLARLNREWNIPFMAVMMLCRSPKNREADDAAWYYEERRKQGWKLRVPPVAIDGHTREGKARLYALARERNMDFWKLWAVEFYYDAALLDNPMDLETNGVVNLYKRKVLDMYGLPYDTYSVKDCKQERILTGKGGGRARAAAQAKASEQKHADYGPVGDEDGLPISGVFWVQSFTDPEIKYKVDLNDGTCTCPAFMNSGAATCKHQMYVEQKEQDPLKG